jgi:hypothetical protein
MQSALIFCNTSVIRRVLMRSVAMLSFKLAIPMKNIIPTLPILTVCILAVVSAEASAAPLFDAELNDQTIYGFNYVTMGAGTNVGGNVQSASAAATLADGSVVNGDLETGAASTIGADDATVRGHVYSGTASTFGASSIVNGDLFVGTTATLGAGTFVGGNIESGANVVRGAGDTVIGTIQQDLALTAGYSAPAVIDQTTQIADAQLTLKNMGTGTVLNSVTFGTNNETLTAGIYSTADYLTIAGGKTLTLDGEGVDSIFIFNISNYLTFAAAARVELINFTNESAIIWNVLGDAAGSAGYSSIAIGASARGLIISRGYVETGANATLTGVGDYCGGIISAENYVLTGAGATIGGVGCTSGSTTSFDNYTPPPYTLGADLLNYTIVSGTSSVSIAAPDAPALANSTADVFGSIIAGTFVTLGATGRVIGHTTATGGYNNVGAGNATNRSLVSGNVLASADAVLGGFGDIGLNYKGSTIGTPVSSTIGGISAVITPAEVNAINDRRNAAVSDLNTAKADLSALGNSTFMLAGQATSKTYNAGVYHTTLDWGIGASQTITLDAQGVDNPQWVFNIPGSMSTGDSTIFRIINGGANASVFWNLGSFASIGASTQFLGTILADGYITIGASASMLGSNADSCGGLYSAAGLVTTGAGVIIGSANCTPPPPPPPYTLGADLLNYTIVSGTSSVSIAAPDAPALANSTADVFGSIIAGTFVTLGETGRVIGHTTATGGYNNVGAGNATNRSLVSGNVLASADAFLGEFGDIGLNYKGSTIGTPVSSTVGGISAVITPAEVNAMNVSRNAAVNDINAAKTDMSALAGTAIVAAQPISTTYNAGVYSTILDWGVGASQTITLDAQGDPNAQWIFNIPGSMTFDASVTVQIVNGGANASVFWNLGSFASIGASTQFLGTILADDDISIDAGTNMLGSNADSCGGLYSAAGLVTTSVGVIIGSENCTPPPPPPPVPPYTLGADLLQYTVLAGGTYMTIGDGSSVYGSVASASYVTLGAFIKVTGDLDVVAANNTGADTFIGGTTLAGAANTIGINSTVVGDFLGGGALTVPPSTTVAGDTRQATGDEVSAIDDRRNAALSDLTDAQTYFNSLTATATLAASTGNVTLNAGVYDGGVVATVAATTITLDNQGINNAVWVFNLTALAVAANANIVVIGGGANSQVFWNSAGYVSAGNDSYFVGTVIAQTYITLGLNAVNVGSNSNSCGGLYSATGYVTGGTGSQVGTESCSPTPAVPQPDPPVNPEPPYTLGADLKHYTVLAGGTYMTMGDGSSVYGSVASASYVTLGAFIKVTGDLDVVAANNTGADTVIGGTTLAGGANTIGINSTVVGDFLGGGALTVGGGTTVGGDTRAATGDEVSAIDDRRNAAISDLTDAQTYFNGLTATATLAASTGNVTLIPGVYEGGVVATVAGTTITLDNQGVDNAVWVFNLGALAAGGATNMVVTGGGANSQVYWNSATYISVGGGASITGTLIAQTYITLAVNAVNVGSNADSCGGIYSATGYVTGGTGSQVGSAGCTPPTPPVVLPDHFVISHDTSGIYCAAETVSVTAKNTDGTTLTSYTGTVTLNTQTGNGSWILSSGSGTLTDATDNDGLATYAYAAGDNGVVTFALDYSEGTATFDIDAYDGAVRDNDSEGDITFAASGFILSPAEVTVAGAFDDIFPTQISATDFPVHITAFGTDATNPTCGIIETYAGNKSIEFLGSYQNPTSGTIALTINGTVIAMTGAATPRNINFNSGKAEVIANYRDAGIVPFSVTDSTGVNTIAGTTNNFVVKPAKFVFSHVERVSDNFPNPAATSAGDGVFIAAGEDFNVTVSAVNSLGQVTPNYGNETSADGISLTHALVAPSSGTPGTLTGKLSKQSGGVFAGTFSWDEVGIISLTAQVTDNDYLGTGPITKLLNHVGRFTPDHFALSVDKEGSFVSVCEGITIDMPFAYNGQMSIVTPSKGVLRYLEQPEIRITPNSKLGNHTKNYTGDFNKLTLSGVSRFMIDDGTGKDVLAPISDTTQLGADETKKVRLTSNFNDGILTENLGVLSFQYNDSDDFFYLHEENSEIAPFTSDINLAIASIIDGDAVTAIDEDGIGDTETASDTVITLNPSGKEIRFGRAFLDNSFGPETSPIGQVLSVEYFDGTKFVLADTDTCTQYNSANVSFGSLNDVGLTLASIPAVSGAFVDIDDLPDGVTQQVVLPAVAAGNQGKVEVIYTIYPWLQYDWDRNGLFDENPTATATFGLFRGNDRIIYQREVFN